MPPQQRVGLPTLRRQRASGASNGTVATKENAGSIFVQCEHNSAGSLLPAAALAVRVVANRPGPAGVHLAALKESNEAQKLWRVQLEMLSAVENVRLKELLDGAVVVWQRRLVDILFSCRTL